MDTQGKQSRIKFRVMVKLTHAEMGSFILHTTDISDAGAYILSGGQTLPGVGEDVEVQVQELPGGDAPIVAMRIVHADDQGIGLEYID